MDNTINNIYDVFETIGIVDSARSLLYCFVIFCICLAVSIYFLYNDFKKTTATINSIKRFSKGNYSLSISYTLNGVNYNNTVFSNARPTNKKITIFYSAKDPMITKLYNDTLIGSYILSGGILVLLVGLINFILVVQFEEVAFKKGFKKGIKLAERIGDIVQ